MRYRSERTRPGHRLAGITLACLAAYGLYAPSASAADRKFLVMLATSPKQQSPLCEDDQTCEDVLAPDAVCSPDGLCELACEEDDDCADAGPAFECDDGICRASLQNPEAIRRRYFVDPDSWAEYWREISYGDVTVDGRTTEWIAVPWLFASPPGTDFIDLNRSGLLEPGAGEPFDNTRPIVQVDLGRGDGFTYATGGGDAFWLPGERFVDMDNDGLWDGFDEATNQMDFFTPCAGNTECTGFGSSIRCISNVCADENTLEPVPDGRPDNRGPWVDLNRDGVPDLPPNCVYLDDSDNDGFPDCCPNGPSMPGEKGCEPYAEGVTNLPETRQVFSEDGMRVCPPTTWGNPVNADRVPIEDCNGNLIPDVCDIDCNSPACALTGWLDDAQNTDKCGGSQDRLPLEAGDLCDVETADGIPDECQWREFTTGCVEQEVTDMGDPCFGMPVCRPVEASRETIPRCEYHDANGNGALDIVEPFEDFVAIVDFPIPPVAPGFGQAYEEYVRAHYPGDVDKVLARREARELSGEHDPLGKLPPNQPCRCANGESCGPGRVCPAGEHTQYDPPDFWENTGSAKMTIRQPREEGTGLAGIPSRPSWYRQAWVDRFGTEPPAWTSLPSGGATPEMTPLELTQREHFRADRGAVDGRGRGWVGCDEGLDAQVRFQTTAGTNFETLCNRRILPEQLNGLDADVIYYDGPAEYVDLPSSKYHASGDAALGEVTSPFSDSISGGGNVAAGPYATGVHGNFGFPAGNVLHMELLAFYNPEASGVGDATLDGRVDQGEAILNGRHDYQSFGPKRLVEDVVETLDTTTDFDDFVDPVTLNAVDCVLGGPLSASPPPALTAGGQAGGSVRPSGVLSGVVLIPPGFPNFGAAFPFYQPIHNQDGLADPNYPDTDLPRMARDPTLQPNFEPQVNWNIFFHGYVLSDGVDNRLLTVSNQYLKVWEGLPNLFDPGPPPINCPIGRWDIMASGGRVHPIPPLKARQCPGWIDPVDLSTLLTPGVPKVLTLPPYEFVRDESVVFLENDIRPGERYYFWSVGQGFDTPSFPPGLPGAGMLVLHADEGSNPEAIPPDQRSGDRPTYLIVQGDGLGELQACTTGGNIGDAGDPWPGTSGATEFGFDTIPAAEWYTENLWTGLDVTNVEPDGNGSVRVTLSWVPTSIPSLQFLTPPGGTSVRVSPTNVRYKVNFRATDVFGGTTIKLYFTKEERRCGGTGALCTTNADCAATQVCRVDVSISDANRIGELRKTTSGTNDLSIDWNIADVPDGRYVIFAELIPGAGADGTERSHTEPRAGRNNAGNGALTNFSVNTAGQRARLETWRVVNIDAVNRKWLVTSSLSQPEPAPGATPPAAFIATTGLNYQSVGGEVQFRIVQGSAAFEEGDSFTFTTTGITAASAAVRVDGNAISEGPRAVIVASPLSGSPPLTVNFDARGSRDPNGEPLQFSWAFGDGTPTATGAQVSHTYAQAGSFTAVLRATNPRTGLFGEASVDINVVNNSPNAVVRAEPTSGPPDLTVSFDGSDSSDQETPSDQLIYQWDFGDGTSANDQGLPGTLIQTEHFYTTRADGTRCTAASPCTFTAKLTVTDSGGKTDSASIKILVGNTNPIASVVAGPLLGPAPLTVRFNASSSFDADGDALTVDWDFGDGETLLNVPKAGPAGDGIVEHTYDDPGTYVPTAVIKDGRGGRTTWPGVTITVGDPLEPGETLQALFRITPDPPVVNQAFTADASFSVGNIVSYTWEWGDGSDEASGVNASHTYTERGSFAITLTVEDAEGNSASTSDVVVVVGTDDEEPAENRRPTAVIAVDPPTAEALIGEELTFDGTGSSDPEDDPLTYQWTFGDGSSPVTGGAATATVTHAYTTTGQFLVRLTVRDDSNAAAEATRVVRVLAEGENRSPIPIIATGPRTGTVGVTLTFDGSASFDPDSDDITYSWDFERGGETIATMTGAVVSRTFAEAGTYLVRLTVTDSSGASSTSDAATVVITPRGDVEPPTPPGPGDGGTGRPQPPDSANQRPAPICGLGILPALFASFLGLSAVRSRRRRRM